MALEIERKFLVKKELLPFAEQKIKMIQGYIPAEAGTVVRIRTENEVAKLTIKAKKSDLVRYEYEYDIPVEDALEMLDKLCEKPLVEKIRHIIPHGNHTWEVDYFEKENQGLIVAEIELDDESETFVKPEWVDREVTDKKEYRNNYLAKQPYQTWERDY